MRARQVGERGLLVECANAGEVAATYAELRARVEQIGAVDIVPAARTVLLDGVRDVDAAAHLVAGLTIRANRVDRDEVAVVEVPVTYDGPDLDEVARQWDVDAVEVARIHGQTEFVVAFCGFTPGFAYCTGLPDHLAVRRRSDPRARVPSGSVGLAGEFTSVYPTASPGGWQLIGTTTLRVWRPEAEQPALLAPGTRVRFVDA